jgi:hypothetical protein
VGREARRNQSAAHKAALKASRETVPPRSAAVQQESGSRVMFVPESVVTEARRRKQMPVFRFSDREYAVLADGSFRRRPKS